MRLNNSKEKHRQIPNNNVNFMHILHSKLFLNIKTYRVHINEFISSSIK